MEEKKNKNKKSKIIKGVALLGLFLLVFGVSYALFSVVLNGTKRNRITTGKLSLELLNESGNTITDDTIGIENAVPVTDKEGKENTPYTFTLKNSGSIDAEYSISLKDLDLAAGEERLNDKYVAIYLEKDYGIGETVIDGPIGLSTIKNRVLDAGRISKGSSFTYKVHIWLKENADNGAMNKVFLTNLKVDGTQITNTTPSRTIVYRGDASGSSAFGNPNPDHLNATATIYADGNFEISGNGMSFSSVKRENTTDKKQYYYFQKDLLKKAGYDVSELNTYKDVYDFVNKESEGSAYWDEAIRYDEEILKNYGLDSSLAEENTLDMVAEKYQTSNPELYKNLLQEYYLESGEMYLLMASINYEDTIESISLTNADPTWIKNVKNINLPKNLKRIYYIDNFNLEKLILPDGLKTIRLFDNEDVFIHGSFQGTSIDELTIPASVDYVANGAFRDSNIKTLNILGSVDSWNEGWNDFYTGTINRQ